MSPPGPEPVPGCAARCPVCDAWVDVYRRSADAEFRLMIHPNPVVEKYDCPESKHFVRASAVRGDFTLPSVDG